MDPRGFHNNSSSHHEGYKGFYNGYGRPPPSAGYHAVAPFRHYPVVPPDQHNFLPGPLPLYRQYAPPMRTSEDFASRYKRADTYAPVEPPPKPSFTFNPKALTFIPGSAAHTWRKHGYERRKQAYKDRLRASKATKAAEKQADRVIEEAKKKSQKAEKAAEKRLAKEIEQAVEAAMLTGEI
jgi:hypothetical protein